MTFPFCEIIGKKLRSIGAGCRREIFVSEIENAVEERRSEDEEEKRTPELERVEMEENGGSKGWKAAEGREKEGEVDEAKSANVTCLFFTIEAHCS